MAEILKNQYTDLVNNPAAFTGVKQTSKIVKKPYKTVREGLRGVDVYTLHAPVTRRFTRQPTVTGVVDQQWGADLIVVLSRAEENDNTGYLLTVVDNFSRFAWVRPLADKNGVNTRRGFQSIIEESRRQPIILYTDKGKEFINREFKNFLKAKNIDHFEAVSDVKVSYVERFNRTLKDRLWRYMTFKQTNRYIDVLQDIVAGYNSTPHLGLGGEVPARVTRGSLLETQIWKKQVRPLLSVFIKKTKTNFKIDDPVRITKPREAFTRGFESNWSREFFHVKQINRDGSIRIKDYAGDPVEGLFYPKELQRISPGEEFLVEKVIRKQGKKTLVKWLGWPEKFNSWISQTQLHKLQ